MDPSISVFYVVEGQQTNDIDGFDEGGQDVAQERSVRPSDTGPSIRFSEYENSGRSRTI